jgi:predicted PurR-regulated permease PerM
VRQNIPREPAASEGVFTRERILTTVLAIFTFLAIYICYRIIEPFLPAMAFALALAVATQTPFNWLKARVGRDTLAAALAVVLVALLIIGPASFLIVYIVQTAVENVSDLKSAGGLAHVRDTLEQQAYIGPLIRELSNRFRIDEHLGNIGSAVASRATGVLSGSVEIITQLAITLFVLFFLYRDCGEAVHALRKMLPLSDEETERIFDRVGSTISATVNGSLTVALVQAILATTVYVILGVPAGVLWGAVTFLTALVPVLGTFMVWAPIAVYLAVTGSVGKALFLVGWGALVVGSVDNLLYPYLVGDKLRLHTVPTFFSVLGGISLFGPSGLIMGPMALAITIALVDVWWYRTAYGDAAEEAISPAPEDRAGPAQVLQEGKS